MKKPNSEERILKLTRQFDIFQVHKQKISQKQILKMAKDLVSKGELEIAFQDNTRIYYRLPNTNFNPC